MVRSGTFTKKSNKSPEKCQTEESKEVIEKKMTIENSPVREGNKETFTKTTITEKEEKIKKTQYVRFTEVSDGSVEGVKEARERLIERAEQFNNEDKKEESPSKRRRSRSTSPVKSTPIVTSARRTLDHYDEEEFGASGRKRRLAALAKKFQKYDEEPEQEEQVAELDVTKEVDVDQELAEIEENSKK